jgi:hypothetical protein
LYGVLGLNLGLLVGCEGRGVVLDGTGGAGGSGGASQSSGAAGGSEDQGSGVVSGSVDPDGYGGAGGEFGTGAAPGYGGAGGEFGTGAAPGYGGAGGEFGAGAAPGYGGAGGEFGTGAAPGYGGAGAPGYGGAYGGAGATGYGGAYGGAGATGYGGAGAAPGNGPVNPAACNLMVAPPVQVPVGTETTKCFGFSLAPGPGTQIAAIYPEIVTAQATHHMVLYRAPAGALPSGECPADDAKGAPIYSWAPGVSGLELPPDVGLGLGTGQFTVEVHYVNLSPRPLAVSGGFCAILTPSRPYEATLTRLGKKPVTVPPGGGTSASFCSPKAVDGARIVSATMDLGSLGLNGRAIVERRSGGFEVVIDQPINDTLSPTLLTSLQLDAGDSIYTSCLHSNGTGQTVNDPESARCNFWMLTYPLGQFGDGEECVD